MDAIRSNVNHVINASAGIRSACKFLILLRSVMNIFRKYTEVIFERGGFLFFGEIQPCFPPNLKKEESI